MKQHRTSIIITFTTKKTYVIDINWSNSTSENTHWAFIGVFDPDKAAIVYTGSRTDEVYDENGEKTETIVYSDGSGSITTGG